jgi:hypothetical protein
MQGIVERYGKQISFLLQTPRNVPIEGKRSHRKRDFEQSQIYLSFSLYSTPENLVQAVMVWRGNNCRTNLYERVETPSVRKTAEKR